MKWIKCSDKMPEINKQVIVAWGDKEENVSTMRYRKDIVRKKEVYRWHWHYGLSPFNVTHWKPLPEPPKEE